MRVSRSKQNNTIKTKIFQLLITEKVSRCLRAGDWQQTLRKTKFQVFKKVISLAGAGVLLCCFLCACSEVKIKTSEDKDILIQIEEGSCSRQEAVFMLMEEKARYEDGQNPDGLWERKIGSENMNDYVKDVVVDRLTRYTAAEVLSDRLAAYPSEDAKNLAGEEAVAAWTKISSLYDVAKYGITADSVNELYYKKAVYDAVYTKITTDATAEITEDSTRVMEADYVVVPVSDGEDAARAIYQSIKEGVEFSEACSQAGYALQTNQQIKRGELNSAVDNIAFALNDGEMSEVISSKEGFYIIHCIDDHLLVESAANYNEIITNAKEEAFKEAYYEFSKEAKMSFDRGYWKKIKIEEIR